LNANTMGLTIFWKCSMQLNANPMSPTARHATLPCGSFWQDKQMTNDSKWQLFQLSYSFDDLSRPCDNFCDDCEDLMMTLLTLGDDLLMTLMTIVKACWWPWWQLVITCWQSMLKTLTTHVTNCRTMMMLSKERCNGM
jgi:hypothetical protein